MTLEELYKEGTERLKSVGIENPSVDAFYLLEHAAGLNRTRYLMFKDQDVTQMNIRQYMDLISRRMERVPYQYIIGTAEFAGLTFEVNPNVLIPRLDTEVLFEHTLRKLGYRAYVLDLCTGSGALGIALKRYRPDIYMVMSDISDDALEVAARNAVNNRLEIADKEGGSLEFGVKLIKSDLFDSMDPSEDMGDTDGKEPVGMFDVIVSNPPYVTEAEYETLMPEVKEHEPKLALTAGVDGLDIYRRIAADAPLFLKENGVLALETGCSQAAAVSQLLGNNGFTDIEIIQDLAGLDRVIMCRKSGM